MASNIEQAPQKLTFRRYKDGDHEWKDLWPLAEVR